MATTADAVSGDPLVSSHFSLDAAGMVNGFFTTVSGLGDTQEAIELKVMGPGNQEVIRKIPGRYEGAEITLKRPITKNMDIWTWRKLVEDGNVAEARTNGSIMMHDQAGEIVAQWDFAAGWPSKVETDTIESSGNSVMQETVTIVFESIVRVT